MCVWIDIYIVKAGTYWMPYSMNDMFDYRVAKTHRMPGRTASGGAIKPLRSPRAQLRVMFRKRASNYKALLRKMTCGDEASYGSLALCSFGLLIPIHEEWKIFLNVCVNWFWKAGTYWKPHSTMGWLRLVDSLKVKVSFAEYSLFYRALSQKRPIIVRSLLIEATP